MREYLEWLTDPRNRRTVLQGFAIGILLGLYLQED